MSAPENTVVKIVNEVNYGGQSTSSKYEMNVNISNCNQ